MKSQRTFSARPPFNKGITRLHHGDTHRCRLVWTYLSLCQTSFCECRVLEILVGHMRQPPDLFGQPRLLWGPGFFPALILSIVSLVAAQESGAPKFTVQPLPLPGANGLVMLDYFAYDKVHRRL